MVLLTESGGRQMAESSLLSDVVLEDLEVLGKPTLGLLPCSEAAVMHQLSLQ